MKEQKTFIAEDGKPFDSKAACQQYEAEQGYSGPIAEYLDSLDVSGRGRSVRRNAIVGFVAWERERIADPDAVLSGGAGGASQVSRYAENTTVGSDRSRVEIEKTLSRYGASSFMYGWQQSAAVVAFEMHRRRVKFVLPLPDRQSEEFTSTPTGRARSLSQAEAEYEKAVRQRWRALALVIKAKLEAVESGITVFEDEFMAHIILPNGQTAGDWMRPQIAKAYESNKMPPLLPHLP